MYVKRKSHLIGETTFTYTYTPEPANLRFLVKPRFNAARHPCSLHVHELHAIAASRFGGIEPAEFVVFVPASLFRQFCSRWCANL